MALIKYGISWISIWFFFLSVSAGFSNNEIPWVRGRTRFLESKWDSSSSEYDWNPPLPYKSDCRCTMILCASEVAVCRRGTKQNDVVWLSMSSNASWYEKSDEMIDWIIVIYCLGELIMWRINFDGWSDDSLWRVYIGKWLRLWNRFDWKEKRILEIISFSFSWWLG